MPAPPFPAVSVAFRGADARCASGRGAHGVEAVEDEVEDELERTLAIAPEPRDVLLHVLGEVRVVVDGEVAQERRREVFDIASIQLVTQLPEREAHDVAVEGVVAVVRRLGRNARLAKPAEQPLHVAHAEGDVPRRREREVASPRMSDENVVSRDRGPAHRAPPVLLPRRKLDLVEDQLDDPVEQVILVRDVVVQRHRLDAQFLAEPAHAQGLDAFGVSEADGGAQHALPCQGSPLRLRTSGHGVQRNVQSKYVTSGLTTLRRTYYLTPYAYTVCRTKGGDHGSSSKPAVPSPGSAQGDDESD